MGQANLEVLSGDHNLTDIINHFQDTIQCYDLEKDSWSVVDSKLPEPMTGVVACHLKLPLHLFTDHVMNNVPMKASGPPQPGQPKRN